MFIVLSTYRREGADAGDQGPRERHHQARQASGAGLRRGRLLIVIVQIVIMIIRTIHS